MSKKEQAEQLTCKVDELSDALELTLERAQELRRTAERVGASAMAWYLRKKVIPHMIRQLEDTTIRPVSIPDLRDQAEDFLAEE